MGVMEAWHHHAIDALVKGERQAGQGQVGMGEGVLRERGEELVRLQSLFQIVFGFYLIYAHKVFDEKAARKWYLNLGKIFCECVCNIIWHL